VELENELAAKSAQISVLQQALGNVIRRVESLEGRGSAPKRALSDTPHDTKLLDMDGERAREDDAIDGPGGLRMPSNMVCSISAGLEFCCHGICTYPTPRFSGTFLCLYSLQGLHSCLVGTPFTPCTHTRPVFPVMRA